MGKFGFKNKTLRAFNRPKRFFGATKISGRKRARIQVGFRAIFGGKPTQEHGENRFYKTRGFRC